MMEQIYSSEKEPFEDGLAAEPQADYSWGGPWTEQKLDTFEKYVKAYLTIMNVYRERYHWKLIYFDGFAGSGERTALDIQNEEESLALTFGPEFVQKKELEVYKGAAERVFRLESGYKGFDYYYFIEKHQESSDKLKAKLGAIQTIGKPVYRVSDANTEVAKMAEFLDDHKNYKCLCLLDPFGMSIDWKTLQLLAGKSVDLWILLPSGVIVNRLLTRKGELMYPERLERFFGMDAAAIKEWFYEVKEENDLFGNLTQWYEKKNNSIERIASLYCKKLKELFSYVTERPLVMKNNHGVPIFHFAFASNNEHALKIAKDIIKKKL